MQQTSEYVGTEGERRDFELTLTKSFGFEGQYGWVYTEIFHDAGGNVFYYKGTAKSGLKAGESIKVRATIKEHSVYEGTKQTKIARPKWDRPEAEKPAEASDAELDLGGW